VFGDVGLAHEGTHGMAEKDQRQSRKVRGDPASDSLEVVEAFAPPVRVGEKAEIGGRAVRAVAAVVARCHDIAGVGRREREPFVARAVLGEAVGDLNAGARRPVGRPAAGEDRAAAALDADRFGFHAPLPPVFWLETYGLAEAMANEGRRRNSC
jgi:hypothetical protein